MHNEAAGQFAIAIDTSASVSNEEVQQFLSEIAAIHRELEPEQIVIVQCDADVQSVTAVDREECVTSTQVDIVGRGGTAFSPAFDYINEHHPDVEATVYLTDLESSDFGDPPAYPVLWVSTAKQSSAPFGDIVYMN